MNKKVSDLEPGHLYKVQNPWTTYLYRPLLSEEEQFRPRRLSQYDDDSGVIYAIWDGDQDAYYHFKDILIGSMESFHVYAFDAELGDRVWVEAPLQRFKYTCFDCGASIGTEFNHYLCDSCIEKQGAPKRPLLYLQK
jgi:outer membrane protein assembly factor BamB